MTRQSRLFTALLIAGLLTLAACNVHAERSDRDQPVDIEADHASVDDRNQVHTFTGNVILTQGSLRLHGEKMVVTQGADGFQTGVATAGPGGLATFRQRREGTNEYIEGEAERIEYDTRSEVAKLFHRAKVTSAGDTVTGDYIEYDAITENYSASRQADGSDRDTRVRVIIQPN